MGGLCPLFFDGAVCQFSELPRPDDNEEIKKVYDYLHKIRSNTEAKVFFSFGTRKLDKKLHKLKIFHKFANFLK